MMNIGPFNSMNIGPYQSEFSADGGNGTDVIDDGFGLDLDTLFASADYSPQIIGRFENSPTGVTIEVFDLISGVNAAVVLYDDECYPIGDTGRWGWSTDNLGPLQYSINQYLYVMTGNNAEEFKGNFIIKNREQINNIKIPRDNSHVRRL